MEEDPAGPEIQEIGRSRKMSERDLASAVVAEVKKVIVGKDAVLVKVLAAILAGGHILLEDIPGVGKTTMALAFAKALGLRFNRVQFTPDVMPSDITGFSLYRRETGRMEYQPGAVLCNLFLADELNRATSRTQSALLEAMEEGQVTVDGVSHPVPRPFMVIATQNPVGAAGTALLPDSQLDRFLLRLTIGYPTPAQELELLRRRQYSGGMAGVEQVLELGSHHMFLASVLAVDVDESWMNEKGKLELNKAGLAVYSHGEYFALGKRLGTFGYSVKRRKN